MHRHDRYRSELGQEDHDRNREGGGDQNKQQDASPLTSHASRQSSLAHRGVGLDVPQVVEDQDGGGEKT